MEDEGRKALVKEGGSVLKRPREEDPKETLPDSATASGTKAEVKAKRPHVAASSANAAGTKAEVEKGWDFDGSGCTRVPLPEMEEEEDEDHSDFIYLMVEGGRLVPVPVGCAPKRPPYDPEVDDPYGVTYEMYRRRKAELKGKPLTLNDPLFTTRRTTWGHPFPFLVEAGVRRFGPLNAAQMSAAREAAAAAAASGGSSFADQEKPEAGSSAHASCTTC